MKISMKPVLLIILLAIAGLISVAQKKTVITKVARFKPAKVTTSLGDKTNGASITKEEASQLITLPLKISDQKNNLYTIDSYQFLYKKKSTVEDEDTGKKHKTFTTTADRFKVSPLPDVWVNSLKDGFQPEEELYFFDIVVKDHLNRKFFAPDLKLSIIQ
jgi:hypothetical protein